VPTTDLVGAPANTVTTFTLDAGEYRQFAADGEMSGSVISSDHPVALNSGNWAFNLVSKTSPSGYVDECHQQIPPVTALGYEYVAAPYTTRLSTLAPESVPYRFVGVVNGTTLSYDPPIAGAPTTLNLGDVADFETTSPFDVKSDATHPFYIAQFMPGCVFTVPSRPDYPGSTDPMLGDPEFVNVLPAKQFLSSYVFYTDVTFRTTNLVLTRRVGSGAVTVDCLGAVTSFTAVGTSGFEIANVDLVRAGVNVGACANGPHTASSADPFGLVVWGTDTAASYAYPAGGSVAALTTVVVPATTQ